MGILILLLTLGLSPLAIAADAKPMTNQDVINMLRAKLPENTILMAVRAAKPEFDTSADGLIKLKTAGVSQGVIEAIIAVQSGGGSGTSVSGSAGPAAATGSWNPEEVILLDGGGRTPMRYLTPQMRNAIRGLGWGGMAQYAVLRGASASLRLKSRQPEFLLAVPNNAQAESYYTVVLLAVRKNNSREIMVGGGYMGYSTGVATDRIIATASEKLSDQSAAPANFVIYRIKTSQPMPPGEYAFVLYNSQVKVIGYFATGLDSYYDFGVD
jgi:hypothetical protein